MPQILNFIKTTIIGGVVFLLPIAATIVIVVKASALAFQAVAPLAEKLPLPKGEATLVVYILGGLLLTLLCFLAGVIVRSLSIERRKPPSFLEPMLEKLPPYVALKKYTDRIAGFAEEEMRPALVRVNDGWQVGFVADAFGEAHLAVFLPTAPDATAGGVHIVPIANVSPLNLSRADAIESLKRSGRGLGAKLEKTSAA